MPLRPITLWMAFLVAGSVQAQETVGALTGRVSLRGSGGEVRPLQGFCVSIQGDGLPGILKVKTNTQGDYWIPNLLPGIYRIHMMIADTDKYAGAGDDITIRAGITTRFDGALYWVGSATGEVRAFHHPMDRSNTQTIATMDINRPSRFIDRFWMDSNAVSVFPGVHFQDPLQRGIRGGLQTSVNATLDGISVRNPATGSVNFSQFVLQDLLENVSVVLSPLNAKYGNGSSGALAATTRTGINDFQGSLRAIWTPQRTLESVVISPARAPLSPQHRSSPVHTPEDIGSEHFEQGYEACLLGPIIKDRLTFTFGARIQKPLASRTSLPSMLGDAAEARWWTYLPGVKGPDGLSRSAGYLWGGDPNAPTASRHHPPGDSRGAFYQGKLFWRVHPEHHLEGAFTHGTWRHTDRYQGMESSASNPFRSTSVSTFGLNYRGRPSESSLVEARLGGLSVRSQTGVGYGDPIHFQGFNAQANLEDFFDARANAMGPGMGATSRVGFLTNGNDASPTPLRSRSETAYIAWKQILASHEFDMGMDYSMEATSLQASRGSQNRVFYAMGRRYDGAWMVYNFWGSRAQTDATTRQSYIHDDMVPEMRTWRTTTPGEAIGRTQTAAGFINDLMRLGDHWTLMSGLRYERWRASDLLGERIASADLSPRLEVKWDPEGDCLHLFSISYAHFRGALTPATLKGWLASAGSEMRRHFWAKGTPSELYGVTQADLIDPQNYRLYSVNDQNLTRTIDPQLKPELTRQIELSYRQAGLEADFFRVSLVHRRIQDMYAGPGQLKDELAPQEDASLSVYRRHLEVEPLAEGRYTSLEIEWRQRLRYLESSSRRLLLQGNLVYALEAKRSGLGGAFVEGKLTSMGLNRDMYAPWLMTQPRFMAHGMLTWRSDQSWTPYSVSLHGSYSSGNPKHPTAWLRYPAEAFSPQAVNAPLDAVIYPLGPSRLSGSPILTWDLRCVMQANLRGLPGWPWGSTVLFLDLRVLNLFDSVPEGPWNGSMLQMNSPLPGGGLIQVQDGGGDPFTRGDHPALRRRTYILSTGIRF